MKIEFDVQFRFVATAGWVRGGGGVGGMMSAFGSGGQTGTCATRSRQAWRSWGGICDQRSAFLRNSARSAGLMPANFAKARMHWERCAGGN